MQNIFNVNNIIIPPNFNINNSKKLVLVKHKTKKHIGI